MYAPRDTHLQTQQQQRFRRRHFTNDLGMLPPHKNSQFERGPYAGNPFFDKISFAKKRIKVNRPLHKVRFLETRRRYAFLRSYWFWYAIFFVLATLFFVLSAIL